MQKIKTRTALFSKLYLAHQMKKHLILFSLLLFLTTPSYSQEEPIDKLFEAMAIESQFNVAFEAMLPMIDQLAINNELGESERDRLIDLFRDWYNLDIDRDKIINEAKYLYNSAFSDQEIEEMITFFNSPAGKKWIEKSPELMQKGARIGMDEATSKNHLLAERIEKFLAELESKSTSQPDSE